MREILLEIEKVDDGSDNELYVEIPGRTDREVYYHIRALGEAGLITCIAIPDTGPDAPEHWMAQHIRWDGHQYLAAVRDDEIWKRTVKKMTSVGGSATLEVVKAVAASITKQALGIPG